MTSPDAMRRACSCAGLLLLLAVTVPGAGDARAQGICVPLERLLALADTGFRRLRGYYDPRLRSWVATYRMPGTSLCTIHDVSNVAYYACRWEHDPQAGTARDAYEDLVRRVAGCLDAGDPERRDLDPLTQVARFGFADSPKTVVVGRSEEPGGAHLVTLEIAPADLSGLDTR